MLGYPRKQPKGVQRLVAASPFARAFRDALAKSVHDEFDVTENYRCSEEVLTEARHLIEHKLVHLLHSAGHLAELDGAIVVKSIHLRMAIQQRDLASDTTGPQLDWVLEIQRQKELRRLKREQKKSAASAPEEGESSSSGEKEGDDDDDEGDE